MNPEIRALGIRTSSSLFVVAGQYGPAMLVNKMKLHDKQGMRQTILLAAVLVAVMWLCAGTAAGERVTVNDPYYHSSGSWGGSFDDQWGLKRIGFTEPGTGKSAWDLVEPTRLTPVIVAVLDTGLDYFHPDLQKDNIWLNSAEKPNGKDDDNNGYVDDLIGWNFVDNNNNPWDLAGHGTITAGIIGATIGNREGVAGINPRVKIMPLKVLNFLGNGRSFGVAEAIYYAVDKGARVINLSLGGETLSRVAAEAVAYAVSKGVVVVVAAGNDVVDTMQYGLASLDTVLTVAATNHQDERAGFSNYGQTVKIAAPGLDILSLRARLTDLDRIAGVQGYLAGKGFVGPEAKYYYTSGTSFSAPFVSGVASLILSMNPGLTGSQVSRMILHSARDIETPGWDQMTGYGLLDARAALKADPDYFTIARIDQVVPARKGRKTVIQVQGTAVSSDFKEAWLEVGYGEKPESWKKAGSDINRQVESGVLAEIGTKAFRKKGKWTVRLMVRTGKHGIIEAWESLNIQ